MTRTTLSEWLEWQETINPQEIDLGLDRIRDVVERLDLTPPPGRVFTVAGTNGKGSTVAVLDALLTAAGYRTGVYTSPHLVRYNERVAVAGHAADDAELVAAFDAIEAVRGTAELTFFEYGTLAAFYVFSRRQCDAWVLEVGLGGRLDAVNVIEPDVALITTVDLDHQAWLGDTVEAIAAEKAGIMRAGKPALFGDVNVPCAITQTATDMGAELRLAGRDFVAQANDNGWSWQGSVATLTDLPVPAGASVQLANQSLALAALEQADPQLVADTESVRAALAAIRLVGRLQHHNDQHEWLLDVAHNAQAVAVLRDYLADQPARPTTVILGMLADKQAEAFVAGLGLNSATWLTCPTVGMRSTSAAELAALVSAVPGVGDDGVEPQVSVAAAAAHARELTPPGGRILVCGSFQVVGPALEWLGLY